MTAQVALIAGAFALGVGVCSGCVAIMHHASARALARVLAGAGVVEAVEVEGVALSDALPLAWWRRDRFDVYEALEGAGAIWALACMRRTIEVHRDADHSSEHVWLQGADGRALCLSAEDLARSAPVQAHCAMRARPEDDPLIAHEQAGAHTARTIADRARLDRYRRRRYWGQLARDRGIPAGVPLTCFGRREGERLAPQAGWPLLVVGTPAQLVRRAHRRTAWVGSLAGACCVLGAAGVCWG